MIGACVYALCAITSGLCVALLLRAYRRARTPLLLWSTISFAVWTVGSLLLFVDLVLVPMIDLSVYRAALSAVAVFVQLVGLIWDRS